jgi:hypothetical protein
MKGATAIIVPTFYTMPLSIGTLSITTLSITTLSITTLSITTLSIKALNTMTLSITTQHNNEAPSLPRWQYKSRV